MTEPTISVELTREEAEEIILHFEGHGEPTLAQCPGCQVKEKARAALAAAQEESDG